MILQLEHITKSFGSRTLFTDVTFKLEEHDRLALVGPNGAGKTTLLNIITGQEDADTGRVLFAKGAKVGYLEQEAIEMGDNPFLKKCFLLSMKLCVKNKRCVVRAFTWRKPDRTAAFRLRKGSRYL